MSVPWTRECPKRCWSSCLDVSSGFPGIQQMFRDVQSIEILRALHRGSHGCSLLAGHPIRCIFSSTKGIRKTSANGNQWKGLKKMEHGLKRIEKLENMQKHSWTQPLCAVYQISSGNFSAINAANFTRRLMAALVSGCQWLVFSSMATMQNAENVPMQKRKKT